MIHALLHRILKKLMQASCYMAEGSRMLISCSVRKSFEILIPDTKTSTMESPSQ